MNVALFARPHSHHQQALRLFADGLSRHGVQCSMHDYHAIVDCDLAVFWAHKPPIMLHQRKHGRHYICLERGYIGDRTHWISAGIDGLNGRATFPPPGDDGGRFLHHHGHLLHDWTDRSGPTVLAGQVPTDASLATIGRARYETWLRDTAAALRAMGREVLFRPHPLAAGMSLPGVPVDTGPLADTLAIAGTWVTYNSNSAVDAVLAGVPTVTMDRGAMAWPVTGHDLDARHRPDRTAWATRLAWCQWAPHEIAEGLAWEHLRACLH